MQIRTLFCFACLGAENPQHLDGCLRNKDVLWALGLGVLVGGGPASQIIDIREASGRQEREDRRPLPGSSAIYSAWLSCQRVPCLVPGFSGAE